MDADPRLYISHIELEPRFHHLVMSEPGIGEPLPCAQAQAVKSQALNSLSDLRVLSCERSPLDRRDVLRDVERVGSEVAMGADPSSAPLCPERVGSVLQGGDPVPITDRIEPVHIEWPPGEV